MIDRATRLLVLWIAVIGLMPTNGFSAARLPPRALARIGSHRFYHGPGIVCAVLSPDGLRAASAANYSETDFVKDDEYDRTIVLWDTTTGERLKEMLVPHGFVSQLAFSADGKQLAASHGISGGEFGVVVFDVETGRLFLRLSGFHGGIGCIQFCADDKQLWVSELDGAASAWDIATGKQQRLWEPPPTTKHHSGTLTMSARQGALSPDGRVIVWEMWDCSKGGCLALRAHDTQTNKLLYQKDAEHNELKGAYTFTADGKRLIADCDKLIVWEVATGKEIAAIKVPGMLSFALAPVGRHAAIEEIVKDQYHSQLRMWDIETGKPVQELLPTFENLRRSVGKTLLAFSSNGKTLLIASDSTLRLFDAGTGEEHAMLGHRAPVTPLFSNDGRTLVTSCDELRCRWDVSGKEPILLRRGGRKAWEIESCLVYSADGQVFLDWYDCRTRVRETGTGRILHTLPESLPSAEFSSDATRLVLYYENSERLTYFHLYDVQTGKKSGEFQEVECCSKPVFSANGRLLAWADCTGAVHLHDAASGKSIRTLRPSWPLPKTDQIEPCFRLLFSLDGKQLIVVGHFIERPQTGFDELIQLPLRVFQVFSGRQIAEFYANPKKLSRASEISCMACSPDGRLLAVAESCPGIIRVLEIASGLVRAEFAGHRHGVHGLAFSPDGKTLASGGEDNVVFLWDVTGTKTIATAEENPASLWDDLASEDGQRAGSAIASLLHNPEGSVAFLCEKLRPTEATSEKRLTQLIADLNADAYAKREAASRELTLLGERAEAALRRRLTNHPTLELRRRIEDLLDKLEPSSPPPETLRTLRAIEVLEHVGTPAARHCLVALAKGAADARQTRAAKSALQRLAKRR
jgi:WD40 repeat protein